MKKLKIKRLHTFNSCKKRVEITIFAKRFLYGTRIFTGSIVIAVCIGN